MSKALFDIWDHLHRLDRRGNDIKLEQNRKIEQRLQQMIVPVQEQSVSKEESSPGTSSFPLRSTSLFNHY